METGQQLIEFGVNPAQKQPTQIFNKLNDSKNFLDILKHIQVYIKKTLT